MPDEGVIRVVSAVVIRDARVLLTQRDPARSDFGWRWQHPGGKVRPDEDNMAALARELQEELGIPCTVGKCVAFHTFVMPVGKTKGSRIKAALYDVDIGGQQPRPVDTVGIGWFGAPEVCALPSTPINDYYRDMLVSRLIKLSRRR